MNKINHLNNIPSDLLEIYNYVDKNLLNVIRNVQLDENINLTIIDVKLHPYKEDKLYNDAKIRFLIPRGCCFIFINNDFVHAIYGHPKFGNIDEYTTTQSYNKLVYRRKENGECSHWSAFQYNNQIFQVYGSKNVHFVVRNNYIDHDLKFYDELRYNFSLQMFNIIQQQIKNETQLNNILQYFISTKHTFCAECCSVETQHLVKYDKSIALFYAVTGQRINSYDSLVKISPIDVDDFFKQFELSTVTETIIINNNKDDIDKTNEYFENQSNSEGSVVYYLDDNNNAIFAYKHKNYDYVFNRALREKMRIKASTFTITHRLNNLYIDHPNKQFMLERGLKFNSYFRSLNEESQKNFFNNWITHNDIFNNMNENEINEIHNNFISHENTKCLNVIMTIGIPGSGKSFIGKVLEHILNTHSYNSKHLEQDMFSHNGKSNVKEYEKNILKFAEDLNITHLILTKSYHNTNVRNTTFNTLSKSQRFIHYTFIKINPYDSIDICIERIMNRQNHKTLFGKSIHELTDILNNYFIKPFEDLTIEEQNNLIINIDINDNKFTYIKNCIQLLQNNNIINFSVDDDYINNIIEKF